jgi:predicted nuclease of predicted toxin-antitoxin system
MARSIRYHLDESAPTRLAPALRLRGIDVTLPNETGLISASDTRHLEYALLQNRAIYTQDADFLRLHSQGVEHAGILYSHPEAHSLGQLIQLLVLVWELLEDKELRNRVEYL